ncbi:type VII secretion protein EccE [Mycolicibacterium pulveris]|uniref:type VII secretion protein EccE n=1 Tax=Mycolicibacterium pulveris TaxID=36813 RepID=UPI003CE8B0CE
MTIRLALALLAIVAAAMAYPWESTTERWVLGVAAAVVIVVFAWWRGLFLTTRITRRLAVWRRNHSKPKPQPSTEATVLLRIDDPDGVGLSLPLVAGYVDRFGVRCQKVRVTSRDQAGARTTWISMTLNAADNLAALQARSPELPLLTTTEVVGRRLADHLRETGLEAVIVDVVDPPAGPGREKWRAVLDDGGAVSAYGIPVDERLGERLAEVWSRPTETWTALEFNGTATHPTITAVCAFRTAEPVRGTPVSGLVPHPGIQRPLLNALDPRTAERLGTPTDALPAGLLERIDWPVSGSADLSRTGTAAESASSAAGSPAG